MSEDKPEPVEMLKRILENYETEIRPLLDSKEYATAAFLLNNYIIAYNRLMREWIPSTDHPYILILGDHLGALKIACEKYPSIVDMTMDKIDRDLGAIDIYLQK